MKRILLVSHSQKSGGAERCLFEAALGLRARGYQVTVTIPSKGELEELLREKDIPTRIISYPWWVHLETVRFGFFSRLRSFASVCKYSLRLLRVIRTVNPDYVLSNTICNPCAALCAWLTGKKHVWFIHEFGKEDHRLLFNFGFYLSSRFMDFTSDKILVNAELVKSKYQRYIPSAKFSRVNINIPQPVFNKEALEYINDKSFDLLLVGQVTANKGQLDAVHAVHQLLKEGFDVKLFIVGQVIETNYYDTIQSYLKEHALQEFVAFISHHPFPFSVVKRFTIGLMCSEFEALGRVTIEYMKAGMPVVGANSGTTKWLINENNGLLYELRNHEDLVSKIKLLVSNPQLRERITHSAKIFADEHFNEEIFINGIVQALEGSSS